MCDCLICAPSLRLSSKCEVPFFNSCSTALHSFTFFSLIIPFTGTHEPSKLTWSHLSGFIAPSWQASCTGFAEVMDSNPVEDTWNSSLKCTYETIAEIIHQVWRSFFQFICPLLPAPIKSWKCFLMQLSCNHTQIRFISQQTNSLLDHAYFSSTLQSFFLL